MEIDSGDECDFRPGTPEDLISASNLASLDLLPTKSKERYIRVYTDFQNWKNAKNATSNSQRVLMAFFGEISTNKKPTTLWANYSMLKATMKIFNDVDIAGYAQLTAFLKSKSSGYIAKKAAILTADEIRRFIDEAPDETWLAVKVACIFGVCGACRSHELADIEMEHVKKHGDLFCVTIAITKTKKPRSFTVTGSLVKVVDKYAALRPQHVTHNRFFVNLQRGKCTVQPIGKNKFYNMPRRIAVYLNLPETELFKGHTFRRSSATMVANTGASIETVKRHGGWVSTKTCDGYIEDSLHYKIKTGDLISSSINCNGTAPSASIASCSSVNCKRTSSSCSTPVSSASHLSASLSAAVSSVSNKSAPVALNSALNDSIHQVFDMGPDSNQENELPSESVRKKLWASSSDDEDERKLDDIISQVSESYQLTQRYKQEEVMKKFKFSNCKYLTINFK